ncbi:MAG TPA: UDP-N-acetylmuramoyl-L-alanine--D-glutamate ligase [Terriglobia bacterium]|nr:UDP-N-acetylmuramoyl-L-alanine--D-glutamate ligase [Terriglobia bacterium]
MQNLEGKRVLVVGLARSGRAAADFFRRRGAVVTASDSRPPWSFADQIPELLAHQIGLEFGQHSAETFLRQDLIVASPGVPRDLPALTAARARGVPVVAEVEAAGWYLKGSLVGVTGSNGKTTTTSLIGRMLEASEISTWIGGNIGKPLISMVDQVTEESAVVAELSSFQLEGTECLHPQVAVLLNITPNHLDRHPSFEAYREAKARILRNQTDADYAVLNADDAAVAALAEEPGRVPARKIFFSRSRELPEGVLLSQGHVVYRVGHLERDLFSPRDVRLRGDFNLENVLAASAAACLVGADFDAVARAVREFRGVEHRLEYAGDVLGVEFYNDSKATSVDATMKALGAFERGVHLILGGKDKGAPYAPLIPLLRERVREVLLIGAAAGRIERELAGAADVVQAGDLETATRRAFERARPGDVVLLSPACSSYDQFTDFEERGRAFKELVEALAREGETGRARRSVFEAERRRGRDIRQTTVTTHDPRPQPVPSNDAFAPALLLPSESPKPGRTSELQAVEQVSAVGSLEALAAGVYPSVAPDAQEIILATPTAATQTERQGASGATPEEPVLPLLAGSTGSPDRPRAGRNNADIALPKRVYVYEMDAEERPPLDFEPAVSIDDVELVRPDEPESGQPAQAGQGSPVPAGEPFIFEIPSASTEDRAATAGVQPEVHSSPAPPGQPGKRRPKRSKVAAETSLRNDDESQDRFPGM